MDINKKQDMDSKAMSCFFNETGLRSKFLVLVCQVAPINIY